MNFSNQLKDSWEEYEHSSEMLEQALQKLSSESQQRLADRYGLSEGFTKQALSEEAAMALCESAMGALAEAYPQHLEAFDQATCPVDALKELEEAEVIWQSEATVIRHFDADGEESSFLNQVRETTMEVLHRKLDDAATAYGKKQSSEQLALCLGCLAVMDQIFAELGYPVKSSPRLNCRKLAHQLKS